MGRRQDRLTPLSSGAEVPAPGSLIAVRGPTWRPQLSSWSGLALASPLLVMGAALVIYPLIKLVADSLGSSTLLEADGLSNYSSLIDRESFRRALAVTLIDSALVTFLAVVMGGVIAWHLRTLRSRTLRGLLWLAVLVPFWMGTVVKNYSFFVILDRFGPVSDAIQAIGLSAGPVDILYTHTAVIVGMLYSMLPYAVLPLFGAFTTIDLGLVRAAEGLGASRSRALWSTVVPLALPSILAASVMVFVISIGFYVTPVLLGGEAYPFVANTIQYDIFTAFDYPAAATAAVVLVIVAAVIVTLSQIIVGRERLERADA